jgi:hypothetical protein
MRRWCRIVGVLSGILLVICLGGERISGQHGWGAINERVLAFGVGLGALGMVAAMVLGRVGAEAEGAAEAAPANRPKRKYVRKKNPVLRDAPGRKRAYKKAVKRRRARKAGLIFLTKPGENGTSPAGPGGEQVGFFG